MSELEPTNPGTEPQDIKPATGADNHFASLEGEDLGFVQNKGWKTVGDMLQSYRNLEKLRGVPENELVRISAEPKEEEIAAVMKRLGAPDNYEDYGIQVNPEDDGPFVKDLLVAMQQAGLTKGQATKLNEAYEQSLKGYLENVNKQIEARDTAQEQEIDKMWGNNAVMNRELCKKAARTLGLTEEQNVKLKDVFGGPKGQYEFMFKIAQFVTEDLGKGMSSPGAGFNTMSLEQAKARRNELMKDSDWVSRYMKGGASEREEMVNLNKIIAGVNK